MGRGSGGAGGGVDGASYTVMDDDLMGSGDGGDSFDDSFDEYDAHDADYGDIETFNAGISGGSDQSF